MLILDAAASVDVLSANDNDVYLALHDYKSSSCFDKINKPDHDYSFAPLKSPRDIAFIP